MRNDIFPELSFVINSPQNRQFLIMRRWLYIAIGALALAGLYSIILVASRTPGVQAMLGDHAHAFFHSALVVHVDFSILVWFLSMGCFLWSSIHVDRIYPLSKAMLWTACLGIFFLFISPFFPNTVPLMNNYVPVLVSPVFYAGLGFFMLAILGQILLTIYSAYIRIDGGYYVFSIFFAIYVSALIVLVVIAFWGISFFRLLDVPDLPIDAYMEALFWGPGHALQFFYVQIMIVAWLCIAVIYKLAGNFRQEWLLVLTAINFLTAISGILAFKQYEITSAEFSIFFTEQMRYFGSVTSVLVAAIILYHIFKSEERKHALATPLGGALVCSIFLFLFGGLLALLIDGVDVTIPAHYHGSLIGISIALMGLVYYNMPRLGFGHVNGKAATIQPYLYTVGQFLHISGLAISGGYGAMRKTPGAEQALGAKIGMGIMGLGGLLTLIGGILFLVIVITAIYKTYKAERGAAAVPVEDDILGDDVDESLPQPPA